MTTPSAIKIDYTQEVRFAVVMYGGISLAIYINGVAQELLHLVRATAPSLTNKDLANHSEVELKGSERVYRKIGQMLVRGAPAMEPPSADANPDIRTRFVVDILSGSSAGGINAVFLAKALANDQPLENLETLWVEEGDMGVLINDRDSLKGTELKLQDLPHSLLNSERMYWELLDAFEGMESAAPSSGRPSPNVEELDLFVTATDIRGQIIKLQLADKMVEERRHRKVFHFVYNCAEIDPETSQLRNDFEGANNPFLAFAARCTSAHPAAFEPMTLGGIDDALMRHPSYKARSEVRSEYPGWQRFYKEYLQEPTASQTGDDADSDKVAHESKVQEFVSRAFNDGGVLDNQPFSHTLDTLPLHHSDLPTSRKLLYIEPAPQNPETKVDPDRPPDFVENAWLSLSTLPRYEPIREHLQRVLDRNRLIERVTHITQGMEQDVKIRYAGGLPHLLTNEEFRQATLADMITKYERGYGWGSYQRLRVGEVTDELVLLFARTLGFDENADEFQALRYIVRYWRQRRYFANPESVPPVGTTNSKPKLTESEFLMDFDLQWRLRRLQFVANKIDDMACFDDRGAQVARFAGGGPDRIFSYPNRGDSTTNDEDRKRFLDILLDIKSGSPGEDGRPRKGGLSEAYGTLRKRRQQLWSVPAPTLQDKVRKSKDPFQAEVELVRDAIRKIDISSDDLSLLLGRLSEKEREEVLNRVAGPKLNAFNDFAETLKTALQRVLFVARTGADNVLGPEVSSPNYSAPTSPLEGTARRAARNYFDYFDYYDMVAHPILYATGAGDELDQIHVFRVSPEDATSLINETEIKKRKLAGTKLANFGAFFKKGFRTNDILWGRLDGAERIITALLPDAADEGKRTELINEAHRAIIVERLGVEDDAHLLDVLRQMNADERKNLSTRVTDSRIKFALETFLLNRTPIEHFKIQFIENYEATYQFNNQDMVTDAARASKVFGKMLEGYAQLHQIDNKRVVWVTRLAQLFWGFVEVAIPGSIANLALQHWLKLIYLFEFLVVLAGTFLNQTMQRFGLLLFAITLATHAGELITSDAMQGRHRLIRVMGALLMIGLVLMVILGIVAAFGLLGFDGIWHGMSKIRTWQAQPAGWNAKSLMNISLLVLIALFFVGSVRRDVTAWWQSRRR